MARHTRSTARASVGELTDTEREADRNAAAAQVDEPATAADPAGPAPVRKHRIRPPADRDRPRAGGHVLTERGWVPEQV